MAQISALCTQTSQPQLGKHLLSMPDVDAGVVERLSAWLPAYGWPGVTITNRFPNSPIKQTPLVVARVGPQGIAIDSRFLYTFNIAVDVWADTRASAFRISDEIRKALCSRGGFRLDEHGVVKSGDPNPVAYQDDSGDPNEISYRFIAGYDLIVRLTE